MSYHVAGTPDHADPHAALTSRYEEYNGSYRVAFDPETDTVSEVVVDLVEYASGYSYEGLPVLYDAIDPDSLNGLFTRSPAEDAPGLVTIAFRYAGYLVTVNGQGYVHLTPKAE